MSLRKWFDEEWVDLGRKGKDGKQASCGRSDADKGAYPKCVPKARAALMSASEKASAVRRKRAAERLGRRKGKKPINVKTEV